SKRHLGTPLWAKLGFARQAEGVKSSLVAKDPAVQLPVQVRSQVQLGNERTWCAWRPRRRCALIYRFCANLTFTVSRPENTPPFHCIFVFLGPPPKRAFFCIFLKKNRHGVHGVHRMIS